MENPLTHRIRSTHATDETRYNKKGWVDIMPKQWDSHEVPQLVDRIYRQVLERSILNPDGSSTDSGLMYYGEKLQSGEMSVRNVVRALGLSQEYQQRFIIPNVDQDGVKLCYKHFLAREPETEGLNYWTKLAETESAGWPAVINGLINSEEYTRRFGDDSVPA
jgi:phycobilisome core-membrane linker protein